MKYIEITTLFLLVTMASTNTYADKECATRKGSGDPSVWHRDKDGVCWDLRKVCIKKGEIYSVGAKNDGQICTSDLYNRDIPAYWSDR